MSEVDLTCEASRLYTGIMGNTPDGRARLRILHVSDESLLSLGVESLLGEQNGLDVVMCTSTAEALEQIRRDPPDAIILDLEGSQNETALEWLRILRDRPDTRLVALNRQDSTICIYHGIKHALREAQDLLAVIDHPAH